MIKQLLENLPKSRQWSIWLFTIPAVAYFFVETRGGLIHIKTEHWEPHAMLHAVQSVMYTHALTVIVVLLAWIPFRKGERWSWWAIAIGGLTLHAGHIIGDMVTGGLTQADAAQGSGKTFLALAWTAELFYIAGLIISRDLGFKSKC